MSKNQPKTVIFPYPFKEQCDMALCSNPKKYTIAVEGSHPSLFFGICEYHMESLLEAIAKHPKLGPMMADKLFAFAKLDKENPKFEKDENRKAKADPTDETDKHCSIAAGADAITTVTIPVDAITPSPTQADAVTAAHAICPYCNKQFKPDELREHMKKCNAGGEHC
jgi:hypothetical protein